MGLLKNDTFVCIDCETTGLDAEKDHVIEVAAAVFQGDEIIRTYETLIDPQVPIPAESIAIHHITDNMVQGKPKISEILPDLLSFVGKHIIIGHGILFDISLLVNNAKKFSIPCTLGSHRYIDTLRLARLYGESPVNSLEKLRQHFNIPPEEAHRAMSDVLVNIEVFKFLTKRYKTTEQILERLQNPILLKAMPLGKHKGRPFTDIPSEYLQWALRKDFDQDLMFSIKTELKKRKSGTLFGQAGNPFSHL